MKSNPDSSRGRVSLVGAGPGDPELLTLKAARRLEDADVVFYDNRVDRRVLELCSAGCRCVDVGKIPGGKRTAQNVINRLLAKEAKQGHSAVRLKGGDPFVFGRGGEEAVYLRERGVDVEIVPGISSCIGVPAAAGVPVTHRGVTTHFSVVTGMSAVEDREQLAASWRNLAEAGGTLVVLMGVRRLPDIVDSLLEAGVSKTTPAAMIQSGTLEAQRTVTSSVDDIVADVRSADIDPPATLVVGDVVALRDQIADSVPSNSSESADVASSVVTNSAE